MTPAPLPAPKLKPGGTDPDSNRPNAIAETEDFEFAALSEAVNYRLALLGEFGDQLRGRVLEIGAGIGQLSADIARLPGVQELCCVEPDPRFCTLFRQHHPTIRLIEGTAAAVPSSSAWDAIVCVNVLEHIREDVAELQAMQRLLAPAHGCLCLFVPARPELYSPIDRDFGHWRRYRKFEVREKLASAGFEVLRADYFNWLGYFAWWANFRVLRQRKFRPASVRFFDRVLFPWVHALERRGVRPPFGQSLIATARALG